MASSDPTATGTPLAAVVPLEGQPLAPEDNFPFTLAGDQFACSAVIPWSFFCGDTGLTSQGCRGDPQAPQRPAGAGLRRPRPAHRPQTMGQSPGPWIDHAVLPGSQED